MIRSNQLRLLNLKWMIYKLLIIIQPQHLKSQEKIWKRKIHDIVRMRQNRYINAIQSDFENLYARSYVEI